MCFLGEKSRSDFNLPDSADQKLIGNLLKFLQCTSLKILFQLKLSKWSLKKKKPLKSQSKRNSCGLTLFNILLIFI